MSVTYKVVEYHSLLMKYASSFSSPESFIPFNEWVITQGYKFKVMDKCFDNFEEAWVYREMLSMQLYQNITFEIVKEEVMI